MYYARSPFRDFESFLRKTGALNYDDIQIFLEQFISNFVTYEASPGIYAIQDISNTVYTMGDHEETLRFEYNDVSMKTKRILTRFVGTFGTLRFDLKKFFKTLLRFTPFWD